MSKRINKNKLVYRVLVCDMNSGKPVFVNIFNSPYVFEETVKVLKKNPTREDFKERLISICKNQFWSRYEYEIEMRRYMEENDECCRIDAYQQIESNIDVSVDYLLTT